MQVPELAAANAKGLPIAIRAANRAGASFVGFTDAAGAERARASGFEPAAVIDAGGRLAVWVQHAPAAEAVRPYLQRATLLAYGQNPETAGRAFGPLAGFRDSEAAAQIAQASGAAYTRSAPLAAELTTARAERLAELGARLRAAGVPNLATFSSVAKNPRAADLEWARLALSRGLAQGDVVAILATQGRHRASAPTTQLRHASNTLAAALGSSRETAHVLRIVASAAAIPLRILQIAAAVLRFGASLAR
ncbi:MAG TPA: DNA-primase RepB domain-containing protein [Thermoanaerobaculia bacterium]|nr:DNA-primase RepB domain-containing protein [Thermoanaerobaculia bacterium]